jgi:hypothetical protein
MILDILAIRLGIYRYPVRAQWKPQVLEERLNLLVFRTKLLDRFQSLIFRQSVSNFLRITVRSRRTGSQAFCDRIGCFINEVIFISSDGGGAPPADWRLS